MRTRWYRNVAVRYQALDFNRLSQIGLTVVPLLGSQSQRCALAFYNMVSPAPVSGSVPPIVEDVSAHTKFVEFGTGPHFVIIRSHGTKEGNHTYIHTYIPT